jgi:hypothetical protein
MKLIVNRWGRHHPSHDVVEEFEAAILEDPDVQAVGPINQYWLAVMYGLLTGWRRFSLRVGSKDLRLSNNNPRKAHEDYFAIMMSLNPQKCLPFFFNPGRKSIYLFDAWSQNFEKIRTFIRDWGIQQVFVSASQSAERLASLIKGCAVRWIPEGVTPSAYACYPDAARDIDVLQIGRKYDSYHQNIAYSLKLAGKSYLFEAQPRQLVFPTRQAFVDGLARTRISICFPSSLTHPQRAGDICTMTTRYLQSMVSGCLVVGTAPKEMIRLFGYNPVVEADMQNPTGQLLSILDNFDSFHELIDKNRRMIMSQHTWQQRWNQISSLL